VYCSISGYGQSGPKSGYAAYDGAIQAASGMMAITGHPETGPTRTGYMPVDMATALNTAFAISAALYRRSVSGEGQRLDVAMMDTAMVMQAPQVSGFLVNGVQPELFGNRSPTRAPTATYSRRRTATSGRCLKNCGSKAVRRLAASITIGPSVQSNVRVSEYAGGERTADEPVARAAAGGLIG
jgi:crotonobetainyl-CoA:carnitine CoA-transferase CaiB-like acyl-CoA transferase